MKQQNKTYERENELDSEFEGSYEYQCLRQKGIPKRKTFLERFGVGTYRELVKEKENE